MLKVLKLVMFDKRMAGMSYLMSYDTENITVMNR